MQRQGLFKVLNLLGHWFCTPSLRHPWDTTWVLWLGPSLDFGPTSQVIVHIHVQVVTSQQKTFGDQLQGHTLILCIQDCSHWLVKISLFLPLSFHIAIFYCLSMSFFIVLTMLYILVLTIMIMTIATHYLTYIFASLCIHHQSHCFYITAFCIHFLLGTIYCFYICSLSLSLFQHPL